MKKIYMSQKRGLFMFLVAFFALVNMNNMNAASNGGDRQLSAAIIGAIPFDLDSDQLYSELSGLIKKGASTTSVYKEETPLDTYLRISYAGTKQFPNMRPAITKFLIRDKVYALLFTPEDDEAIRSIDAGQKKDSPRVKLWLQRFKEWEPKEIHGTDTYAEAMIPKK